MHEPRSVMAVLRWIAADPWAAIGRRWNYKSAVLSSLVRSTLFFATNLTAGTDAALGAMAAELVFRFATAGFYGAMTQAFRRVEPAWAATGAAMIVLPVTAHSLELFVHWARGTPNLATSLTASVALTAASTSFHLFAMRRGALVVGDGRRSLLADLTVMPRLIAAFIVSIARACARPAAL